MEWAILHRTQVVLCQHSISLLLVELRFSFMRSHEVMKYENEKAAGETAEKLLL